MSVRVLGCAGLSADVQTFNCRYAGCTSRTESAVYGSVHATNNLREVGGVYHCIMSFLVFRVDLYVLRILYYMRNIVESAVCYCSTEVGQVDRGTADLALSDGQGNDGSSLPATFFVAADL